MIGPREFWLPLTTLIVNSYESRPDGIHVIEMLPEAPKVDEHASNMLDQVISMSKVDEHSKEGCNPECKKWSGLTSREFDEASSKKEIESLRKQVEMLEEALKVLKVAVNDKGPDLGATLYIGRILTRLNTMRSKGKKDFCPPHSWDRDGERCTKCGDKDWMT